MKNCKEISQLASRAYDEKISLMETVELKVHLMMCKNCRAFDANNKQLSKILKAQQEQDGIPTSEQA